MKIAVYDKKNKDRLLGYFNYTKKLTGGRVVVLHVVAPYGVEDLTSSRIEFDVSYRVSSTTRKVDEITEETLTVTRRCFLTDEPLSSLRKHSAFILPGGEDGMTRENFDRLSVNDGQNFARDNY